MEREITKITKKVMELEVIEQLVEFCQDRANWYREVDAEGNVTFTSKRREEQHKIYLAIAEKLEKEYTK